MDGHIDWISFTRKEFTQARTAMELYQNAKIQLKKGNKHVLDTIYSGIGFDPAGSRAPYRVALSRNDNGARIYGASHTETILYELTGRGCEPLRNSEVQEAFLGDIFDSVTRLDYAVDIQTRTTPPDFSNARNNNSFRSVSFIRSTTGETCYIGSPKSDRFCRVYRYNPPHPRAHLLRVEFVFRRKLAKSTAEHLQKSPNEADFVAKLGNTFGFTHADWRPESDTDAALRVPIIERHEADTVFWVYKQVTPAIRRLMHSGALDITDWLEYVYSGKSDY